MRLHQHDGIEDPYPMYITLTTKTRFSSRLNSLVQAANEGRGISQLKFLDQVDEVYSDSNEDDLAREQDRNGASHAGVVSEQSTAIATTSKGPDSGTREDEAPPDNLDQQDSGSIDHAEDDVDADADADANAAAVSQDDIASKDQSEQANDEHHETSQTQDTKAGSPGVQGGPDDSTHAGITPDQPESEYEDELIDYNDGGEDNGHDSSGSSTVQGDTSVPEEGQDVSDMQAATDLQHNEAPTEGDAPSTHVEETDEHGQDRDHSKEQDDAAVFDHGDAEDIQDEFDVTHEGNNYEADDSVLPPDFYHDADPSGFEQEGEHTAEYAEGQVDLSQFGQATETTLPADALDDTYDELEHGAFVHEGAWEGYEGQNDQEEQELDTESTYVNDAVDAGEVKELQTGEHEAEAAVDDLDTVNYDEEDAAEDLEPVTRKRSFDEHNEGDGSDGSEQGLSFDWYSPKLIADDLPAAKRMRAT